MPDPTRHVGALLRREREQSGRTVREVALYVGITPANVLAYERDPRPNLAHVRLVLSYLCTRPRVIHQVRRLYVREGRCDLPNTHNKTPRTAATVRGQE